MTLTHLRGLASNYNLSYDIDTRFQSLALETQAVALAVNRSQAAVQGDLSRLKTWMQKSQRRSRKLDSRLLALDSALSDRDRQLAQAGKEREAQGDGLAGLGLALRALQDTVAGLTHLVQSQGARLAALEGRLQVAGPGAVAPGPTPALPPPLPPPLPLPQLGLPSPGSPKLQRGGQALRAPPEPGDPPQDFTGRLQGTREPPGPGSRRTRPPERPGESKYHGPPFPRWCLLGPPVPSEQPSPQSCAERTLASQSHLLEGRRGPCRGWSVCGSPAAWPLGTDGHTGLGRHPG